MRSGVFLMLILAAHLLTTNLSGQSEFLTADQVVQMPSPEADKRIWYGSDPLQFGDLRLPEGEGPFPVAVLVHGGCWLSQYDLEHLGPLAQAFTDQGIATWTLEYRRVGNEGGGWPGTFLDAADGTDYVTVLSQQYPLDLERVIAIGHSAGGHLALWLAGRSRLGAESPLYRPRPLALKGVLALAAAADLELVFERQSCDQVVEKLLGGSPEEVPDRYAQGSPRNLLPFGIPQILLTGVHDQSWKPVADSYYQAAAASGDPVEKIDAPEAAHFEIIVPDTSSWPLVRRSAMRLLGMADSN